MKSTGDDRYFGLALSGLAEPAEKPSSSWSWKQPAASFSPSLGSEREQRKSQPMKYAIVKGPNLKTIYCNYEDIRQVNSLAFVVL